LSLLKDELDINFKAARSFLEEHQNDIGELHHASGVENPRSHNRQNGRDMAELKRFDLIGQDSLVLAATLSAPKRSSKLAFSLMAFSVPHPLPLTSPSSFWK